MNAQRWANNLIAFQTWYAFLFLPPCLFAIVAINGSTTVFKPALLTFLLQVSFCVAPAVMLYCFGFDAPLEKAALTIYVLCGVARLARFNVAAHLVPKNADGKALYHEGLATAYAALIISTTVAVLSWMSWTTADLPLSIVFAGSWCEFHPVMGLLVILSFMMASQRLKLEIDGSVSIPVITLAIFAGCWSCSPPSTGRYEI